MRNTKCWELDFLTLCIYRKTERKIERKIEMEKKKKRQVKVSVDRERERSAKKIRYAFYAKGQNTQLPYQL